MYSSTELKKLLETILEGRGLSYKEACKVAIAMLRGVLDDVVIAAFLVALRARGETSDIVAGFARALRRTCVRVESSSLDPIDTAGTGGDASHTINASTAAAIVAASVGAKVLKHGNRGISSYSGSADFMEALGYQIKHGPSTARCLLERVGFAFLYAPNYHPAMKRVMPVRVKLGIRTVFNLVGPLSNPGLVKRQVLGVASPNLLSTMAEAGIMLGYKSLLVVHGEPGIDEVSVSGRTTVYEVKGSKYEKYYVEPEDLGLRRYSIEELKVSDPRESVERFMAVVSGRGRSCDRDFIAANAGAALYVAGKVRSIRDGVEAALQAISEGRTSHYIKVLQEVSRLCFVQSS